MKKTHPERRKLGTRVPLSFVVIATEGELTEKQYFTLFDNKHVKVEVIPAEGGKSSPQHVLDRLDKYKSIYEAEEGDTFWLMVDRDRWSPKQFSEITREAKKKGYKLAISNPCFECWLHLHFDDIHEDAITSKKMEARLRKLLGSYNKSKLDVDKFKGREQDAVKRAKALDKINKDSKKRWPIKTGTHVYKVVEKIFELERDI